MLDRKFEKFHGGPFAAPNSAQNAPRVTLNRNGLIYMNGRMYAELGAAIVGQYAGDGGGV